MSIRSDEIDILMTPGFRQSVADNIGRSPFDIALDKRIPHSRLVASQVKYLQKAKTKLPSYYRAQCIIPQLAYEQSSSEAAAANKSYHGELAIDLTGGLGVDSLYLSHNFTKVIAVERDPVLAEIARINFGLLDADNIEVVCSGAEEFLARNLLLKADLVYADPDRRNAEGKKLVTLSDCSPDIITLLPVLKQIAPKVVVKLSPLFDVQEVFRIFGENVRTEVVSLDGECKEVIAEIDSRIERTLIRATSISRGSVEYVFDGAVDIHGLCPGAGKGSPTDYKYLIVPDVALAKARVAVRYFMEKGDYMENENSFAFSNMNLEGATSILDGRVFGINKAEPFVPKKLKKELKDSGVKRINVLKRDFPLSTDAIIHQLGVGEGGEYYLAFTRVASSLWVVFLE